IVDPFKTNCLDELNDVLKEGNQKYAPTLNRKDKVEAARMIVIRCPIRDPDPVVVLENEVLYGVPFPVNPAIIDRDFLIPIGKAKIIKPGKHVTVVGHSRAVKTWLLGAAELAKKGIEVEVINLRSLHPLDTETIFNSVKKTHHLGWPQNGIGAEICARVMEDETFFHLDAPVWRVCGVDVPTPYAITLESAAIPEAVDVVAAVTKVLGKK
uniref:Pyruvate dehydrogenase E1 component subunit beta n=1 Tax=Glossina palpalis gambiensis TaxID=67801 RepID=A0A1B0AKG8_9MUSC